MNFTRTSILQMAVIAVATFFAGAANAQFLDFNFDGDCDADDMDILCSFVDSPIFPFYLDLDGDGQITAGDENQPFWPGTGDVRNFRFWLAVKNQASAPYLLGDTNLDGYVDGIDLLTVYQNLFSKGNWSDGDFNCDGYVDGQDFLLLRANLWQSNL